MQTRHDRSKTRWLAVPLAALGLLLAGSFATATPAHADRDHRRGHRHAKHVHADRHHGHRHDHGVRHRGHGRHLRHDYRARRHARFVIPSRIHARHIHRYDRYYWDRVYYPRHRHFHAVYRFPVHSVYGVDHRAYAYCNGDLYRRGYFAYDGPRFSIGFEF